MLFTLKPYALQEGFCKKSIKCSNKYYKNKKGFRKDTDWSWLYYLIPIVLSITLFFILPRKEEYIALVLMGVTVLVFMLYGLYKLIKHFTTTSCPKCYNNNNNKNTRSREQVEYVENIKPSELPQADTEMAATAKSMFVCPNEKPFDPSQEPPGSALMAGYNYNECIKNGFSVDFCTITPLEVMGPGSCLCDGGKIGYRDPENLTSCDCP
tara:strand:+ start:730 stop:1359 length:630 start_codon:yes stop_codon:yes gene_type:complete